jgi:hypothetical protein
MRVVLQELAIFVLPILLYAVYLLWRRRQARRAGTVEPPWEQGHWFWVILAGLVLAIAAFFVFGLLVEHSPQTIYRPPSWKP